MCGSSLRLRLRLRPRDARLLAPLLALLTSCAPAPEEPVRPDVSPLVASYARPGGTLDTSGPAPWLDSAEAQVELLGGGNAEMLITTLVSTAFDRIERTSLPSGDVGPLSTRIDGLVTLQVRCGLDEKALADVALAVVDGKVVPLLWGTAHGCPLWNREGQRAAYDGTFTMYRYPDGDILVRVDGTLAKDPAPVRLDFRLANGRLETRVPTTTGDLIVSRVGRDVLARAANGTFRCSRKVRTCH